MDVVEYFRAKSICKIFLLSFSGVLALYENYGPYTVYRICFILSIFFHFPLFFALQGINNFTWLHIIYTRLFFFSLLS